MKSNTVRKARKTLKKETICPGWASISSITFFFLPFRPQKLLFPTEAYSEGLGEVWINEDQEEQRRVTKQLQLRSEEDAALMLRTRQEEEDMLIAKRLTEEEAAASSTASAVSVLAANEV